jgi:hypothetical protein
MLPEPPARVGSLRPVQCPLPEHLRPEAARVPVRAVDRPASIRVRARHSALPQARSGLQRARPVAASPPERQPALAWRRAAVLPE